MSFESSPAAEVRVELSQLEDRRGVVIEPAQAFGDRQTEEVANLLSIHAGGIDLWLAVVRSRLGDTFLWHGR